MSDRSLKSVTYFSFDQLSEEEQEVQGAQCPPQAFQLPHIGGQVSVPAAGDAGTRTSLIPARAFVRAPAITRRITD